MNFLYKAALQRILSHLPYGVEINERLRRKTLLSRTPLSTISECLRQVQILNKHGIYVEGKNLLEIGTGWKPIFPLCYLLLGAEKVITVDLNRYLTKEYLRLALEDVLFHLPQIRNDVMIRNLNIELFDQNIERIRDIYTDDQDFDKTIEKLGIQYIAPGDARSLKLADSSIDIYESRAVMEHVAEDTIDSIYHEAYRLLKPSHGCMIQDIDISDHWSYFDKKITRINFLQYNGIFWKLINSPIAYQNRFRQCHHLETIQNANFTIGEVIPKKNKLSGDFIDEFRKKMDPAYSNLPDFEFQVAEFTVLARVNKN